MKYTKIPKILKKTNIVRKLSYAIPIHLLSITSKAFAYLCQAEMIDCLLVAIRIYRNFSINSYETHLNSSNHHPIIAPRNDEKNP